jgi:hypothetical protein
MDNNSKFSLKNITTFFILGAMLIGIGAAHAYTVFKTKSNSDIICEIKEQRKIEAERRIMQEEIITQLRLSHSETKKDIERIDKNLEYIVKQLEK